MRSIWMAFALVAIATQLHAAQKVAFPYEATVEAGETYVRSGPGGKYYPTGKLKQGQKVTVQRHDPGGWHMIFPPEGSFSWVPARSVTKTAADRGTINGNDVEAGVGSFESDIREFFQRTLSKGDEVRILGEKKLLPEKGKGAEELWYRIAPPRGEWRWVAGQALSPPPRESGLGEGGDPFDGARAAGKRGRPAPAMPAAPIFDEGDDRIERPGAKAADLPYLANDDSIVDRPVVRHQGRGQPEKPAAATGKRLAAQLDELERLDARFRSILDKDPLEWDFSQLERDYIHLRAEAGNTNLEQMIDLRLARMGEYKKTLGEHEELARLADETLRRDAELAEIQHRHEARLIALRQPRYDGAGIIERAALGRRGAPKYALLAPSGKVVAYLVAAPGVDLEAWVGRTAGVSGSRIPHPDLKADLITVVRLAPVRLSP